MANGKRGIIVWALDPSQKHKVTKSIVAEMKTWAKKLNCDVQPVSMYSNAVYNFPLEMPFQWMGEIEVKERKFLNRYIAKLGGEGFLAPELLFVPTLSNRRMAVELAKYAAGEKAQLIFANTRAKKTWSPIRLGGFAEALIAGSEVPMLLMNLKAKTSGENSSLLFPTNFSRESTSALKILAPWAKAFNSNVVLYNQVEAPYSRSRAVVSLLKDFERSRRKKAKGWVNFLQERGVKGSFLIQRQNRNLVSDILDVAKKNKNGLIALSSHPGRFAQTVLGGTARDVLLQARCPVLVFHRPQAPKVKMAVTPAEKPTSQNEARYA